VHGRENGRAEDRKRIFESRTVSDQQSGLCRMSVRLDHAVFIERAILEHAARLGKAQAERWLRSLLVQGFLVESRVLHAVAGHRRPDTARPSPRGSLPPSAFAAWLGSAPARAARRAPAAPAGLDRPAPGVVSSGAKPFAHLRKVIG